MKILRAKTKDLFQSDNLTECQKKNSELNKAEILEQQPVLKSYPARIVLELTNACNLNCIMCGRNYSYFKPTVFNMDWLKKFEAILYHVEEVTLIGWGEPTMHPRIKDILKYLSNFPIRKFMCTNGMLLDTLVDEIFDYRLDLLTVSLDGSDAEKNEFIRQGSDFDRVINNIKKISDIKKEKNLTYPYLSTTTTVMKKNIDDFPNIVKLAGELGINECKAVYLTAFSDELAGQTLYNCQNNVIEAFNKAVEIAEKYNINLKLPFIQGEDEAADNAHKDCFAAWRDFFMSSDGYVRPCMSTPIKLLKLSDYETFFDLWNSAEMVDFRKKVNGDEMPHTCSKCYQASFANWNKRHSFIQHKGDFAPEWEK